MPEFEDLVRRKLCTQHEVKQLIKRREKAEYLLHRREPTYEDFLHAAELEMNLEQLIKCRRKRLGLPKSGASDNMVRRRIHFIFDRATRRFKGNENLWLMWIEYAIKSKALKKLPIIFARALAVLPRSVVLWVKAAAWELETRGNPGACQCGGA